MNNKNLDELIQSNLDRALEIEDQEMSNYIRAIESGEFEYWMSEMYSDEWVDELNKLPDSEEEDAQDG